MPEKIHPMEYLAWLRASLTYYDAIGAEESITFCTNLIRDIKKQFDIDKTAYFVAQSGDRF